MEQLVINLILLGLVCWALLHSFTVSAKLDRFKDRTKSDIHDLQVDVAVIDDGLNYLGETKMTDEELQIDKLAKKYSEKTFMYMHGVHFEDMTDSQRESIKEFTEYILKAAMYGLLYPESEE